MLSAKRISCWVPHCNNTSQDANCSRVLFPLPKESKFKETWLALTGKKVVSESEVYYCDRHFKKSTIQVVMGKIVGLIPKALPFYNMPQMICRTCLSTIPESAYFCVLSATIPCSVPKELETDLIPCRPEPLYQLLTFCILDLLVDQNPPTLVCLRCYHNIWHYFIFKLQCNTLESRIRGNLSIAEYGRALLCRCCPERNGRFFFLHEVNEMGQILKKMFLSCFPTDIVPLKVCLKCWNVVYKLTEFHKKCVSMDKLLQRYSQLSEAQAFYNTQAPADPNQLAVWFPTDHHQVDAGGTTNQKQLPAILPPVKKQLTAPLVDQMQLPGNEMPPVLRSVEEMDNKAANGNGDRKRDAKGVPSVGFNENRVGKVTVSNVPGGECVEIVDLTDDDCKVDPSMPVLEPQVEDKRDTKANGSAVRRKNFTQQNKLSLAKLVVRHSVVIRPDLDPIEKARLDLEMWTKVMNDLFNQGHSVTLKYVQSVWSRMKIRSKLLRKTLGPMTYMDYLVNVYLTRAGSSSDLTDSSSSSVESEADSRDGNSTEAGLGKNPTEVSETKELRKDACEDGDVIFVDDDPVEGGDSAGAKETDPKSDISDVQTSKSDETTATIDGGDGREVSADESRTIEVVNVPVIPDAPKTGTVGCKPPGKRGRPKKSEKAWSKEQKFDLVREVRKEYNTLLEDGTVSLNKASPWKVILEKLASRGYKNCSFSKLYTLWSKMKVSATIYEKNGLDVVDEEVWDLLQFHKDFLEKKSGTGNHATVKRPSDIVPQDKTSRRSTSPSSKKSKLLVSDDGRETMPHGRVDSTVSPNSGQTTGEEVLSLLKTYRDCKDDKGKDKPEGYTEKASSNSVRPQEDKSSDAKLDLISVIRSFGNEVFKSQERSKRTDFWARVTTKFRDRGHDWTTASVRTAWSGMLHSAKLTWAQDGRMPNVGDPEIIDFMTDVIKQKEKCKNELDLSVEEDGTEPAAEGGLNVRIEDVRSVGMEHVQNEGMAKANVKVHVTEDFMEGRNGSGGVSNAGQASAKGGDSAIGNGGYDYVSLDDLKKLYRAEGKRKPFVPDEVIEIDSD